MTTYISYVTVDFSHVQERDRHWLGRWLVAFAVGSVSLWVVNDVVVAMAVFLWRLDKPSAK